MPVSFVPVPGLPATPAYHHVAVGTGTRQVHVAGQVARDADGGPLSPADLAGQVGHALRAAGAGLRAAGAAYTDVVRLTFYVVGWTPDQMGALVSGIEGVAGEVGLSVPMPPSSLIGVQALFEPDVLVEVEATAVLP